MTQVLWTLNGKLHKQLKKLAKDEDSTLPLVASKIMAQALSNPKVMKGLTFNKAKRRGRKPAKRTRTQISAE